MTSSGRLAVLSVVVAIGALAAYVLLLRVAVVRNHPEGYVVAFALAMALAALAVGRARARRWPAWLALGLLADAAGRPVSLADYRGKKPVVLVFYRGYW
ncbi:MAG: hypothetical protein DMD88_21125 [Candidatus Rokuibacteriota bacterium]|nr:MAG: hypothetical protein DMD88_21125 [Candidatus Rokubacteria bacterium]